jgi:flagellar hook-associated protein 2
MSFTVNTSDTIRLTGLATGLDVDSLVKQMMKAENIKMDKLKQQRQLTIWKQEAYRDIMSDIADLKNTYFDILKSDTYALSSQNYSLYEVSSDAPNVATAAGGAGAIAGDYVLSNIQVAAKASYTGSNIINMREADNPFASLDITEGVNDSLSVTIDDNTYDIKLTEGTYATIADLAGQINEKLAAEGIDTSSQVKAVASGDGTRIAFVKMGDSAVKVTGDTVADNSMVFETVINGSNNKLTVNIGSASYEIAIAEGTYSPDELVLAINDAAKTAQPVTSGEAVDISGLIQARMSPKGTNIQFYDAEGSGSPSYINLKGAMLYAAGYSSMNIDVDMGTSSKMSSLVNGEVTFKVNGKEISYDLNGADKDRTILDIMSDISSKAGVDIKYNELSKHFEMYSTTTGADQKFDTSSTVDVTGSFLSTLFGTAAITDGRNAKVTIKEPGGSPIDVEKSTNNFTINGITYSLLSGTEDDPGSATIKLTTNVDKTYDKIKGFIDKYNEVIDKIQTKIDEKRNYDYAPLTDDQKEDMSDDQIEKWEDMAKEGLLHNDSSLENILYSLRGAFYDAVEGTGIYLTDIGLSTSSDYDEGGKIMIDESKLKSALENNGVQVINFFTKSSSISYDADHRTDVGRYDQIGVFQRVNDILKDYTRTTRSSNGEKGILVEIAGLEGDSSEFDNSLYDELDDQNDKIDTLAKKLVEKETTYYNKFAQLESVMQQLNSQSNWLYSMLGGGQ